MDNFRRIGCILTKEELLSLGFVDGSTIRDYIGTEDLIWAVAMPVNRYTHIWLAKTSPGGFLVDSNNGSTPLSQSWLTLTANGGLAVYGYYSFSCNPSGKRQVTAEVNYNNGAGTNSKTWTLPTIYNIHNYYDDGSVDSSFGLDILPDDGEAVSWIFDDIELNSEDLYYVVYLTSRWLYGAAAGSHYMYPLDLSQNSSYASHTDYSHVMFKVIKSEDFSYTVPHIKDYTIPTYDDILMYADFTDYKLKVYATNATTYINHNDEVVSGTRTGYRKSKVNDLYTTLESSETDRLINTINFDTIRVLVTGDFDFSEDVNIPMDGGFTIKGWYKSGYTGNFNLYDPNDSLLYRFSVTVPRVATDMSGFVFNIDQQHIYNPSNN